jgi:tetratricopeptide (TPR) repeat protein
MRLQRRFFLRRGSIATLLLATLLDTGLLAAKPSRDAEELYNRTEYSRSLALLDSQTDDPLTHSLIGRNYYMMAEFKKAAEYFQRAVQEAPNDSNNALWMGRALGRRAETSNPLFAPALAVKARQWMEKAVQLDGKNVDALSDLFEYYLEAPGFLGGGYDKAQVIADRIGKLDVAESYFVHARLAEKREEYEQAEADLRSAMGGSPQQVGRVLDLAKFLAKRGRTVESDALFARAEEMAPDTPEVWYARADALVRQKRNLNEAKALLERYLSSPALTPDDPSRSDARRLLKQTAAALA